MPQVPRRKRSIDKAASKEASISNDDGSGDALQYQLRSTSYTRDNMPQCPQRKRSFDKNANIYEDGLVELDDRQFQQQTASFGRVNRRQVPQRKRSFDRAAYSNANICKDDSEELDDLQRNRLGKFNLQNKKFLL